MPDFDENKRLAAIRQSISDMDDDELHELLGRTRNNRAQPAKVKKSKAKKSSAKKKKGLDLSKLKDLTPEQAAKLLKKLEEDA